MNKLQLIILFMISIIILNACAFGGNRMSITDNSNQLADARFQQIIDAISIKDQDGLKAMFSKQALSDAANFDKELESLFQYVQGDIESWESTGAYTFPEEINADGAGNHIKEAESTYVFTTSEQEYRIAVYEYTIDTANPDNVGVYSICIISSKDDQYSEIVYWGSGEAGINIG